MLGRTTVLLYLFSGVAAATAAAQQETLTLETALELADREHPVLAAAAAALDGASAGITSARAYPNPLFSSQSGRQTVRLPGNVPGMVQILSYQQPLEIGRLRPSRLELAEQTRRMAATELAARRLAVLSQVRRTFYQVLRYDRQAEIQLENLRLVEELRRRIQVQVEVGEAARLELVRADAEIASARALVNRSRLERVAALAAFRSAVGAPLPDQIQLIGAPDEVVALPPLEALREQVLREHPGLRLAEDSLRRAEAQLRFEEAQRVPQPVLRADLERYPDVPNFRFGIDIPIPLWNRRQGPIAEAVAGVKEAHAQRRWRQLELITALEGAFQRYRSAHEQVLAFERGILAEAEAALKAAQAAFQLGERGILEVLDAQRLLRSVRLDHVQAIFDRQAALIDLDELRALEPRKTLIPRS